MRKPMLIAAALVTAVLAPMVTLQAGPRQSANYNILTDALDLGGAGASSASYDHRASAGLISGISTSASGDTLKSGYIAQLDFSSIALEVVSAVSRKVHGAAGPFDIELPLTGGARVESRTGGANGIHRVMVTFTGPVAVAGTSITSSDGQASGVQSVNGSIVTVDLRAVGNAQTLGITLVNVSNGTDAGDVFIPMGVLLGDTTGDGKVNSGDVLQTRNRSGQTTGASNFRSDYNLDGNVNSGDAFIARSRSGTFIP
jgi:hypothetical protein